MPRLLVRNDEGGFAVNLSRKSCETRPSGVSYPAGSGSTSIGMYALRWLLLWLVALGLPIPGGVTVSLCFCRGDLDVLHAHESTACCRAEAKKKSCCGATETNAPAANDVRACDGCVVVSIPQRAPTTPVSVKSTVAHALPLIGVAITSPPVERNAPLPCAVDRIVPRKPPLDVPLRI